MLEDFFSLAQIAESRMLRAQAQAVAKELRKAAKSDAWSRFSWVKGYKFWILMYDSIYLSRVGGWPG